jgi:hypothetical protein
LALAPLREIPGVEWISLMPDKRLDWMRPMTWIKDADGPAWDWEDTSQVIESLDAVVSCDTAALHLSASLGIATIAMLPLRSDHKWGTGETSVWYPQMKLFRQKHPTDWSGVIAEVCEVLGKATVEVPEVPAEIR